VDFAAFAGLDAAVASALHSVASPPLTRLMWVATVSGDTTVMVAWTALTVVLLWAWGRRRAAVVMTTLMLLDPWLADILKDAFARPRPPTAGMLVAMPSGLSFPSGHAMATLLFYGLLAVVAVLGPGPVRRKAAAVAGALACAVLVGASRVYLGVHFASDVVAGWAVAGLLVGVACGALALWGRLEGPEAVFDHPTAQRARYVALAVTCAVVAIGVLVLQTGLDPLL